MSSRYRHLYTEPTPLLEPRLAAESAEEDAEDEASSPEADEEADEAQAESAAGGSNDLAVGAAMAMAPYSSMNHSCSAPVEGSRGDEGAGSAQ